MIYELLVQFFENGVAVSKPETVQVCPALRVKSITERGYEASDDEWFYGTNLSELRRGGQCIPARWDDRAQPYAGRFYDAEILCGANAGEAYSSSSQYARTKLRYDPNRNYPPERGKGRYANLICKPVKNALIG